MGFNRSEGRARPIDRNRGNGSAFSAPRATAPTPLRVEVILGLSLGASIARDGTPKKETEMRTHLERTARVPLWIAGLLICVLTPLGMIAIGRSIPASYASIPDQRAAPRHAVALTGSGDSYAEEPKAQLSVARGTLAPPNRARCPECGVIQSMREVPRSRLIGAKDAADVAMAAHVSTGASANAIAADAISGKTYEMTVRFRDGATTVFNEATPRTWRTGNRVIVIAHASASHN